MEPIAFSSHFLYSLALSVGSVVSAAAHHSHPSFSVWPTSMPLLPTPSPAPSYGTKSYRSLL
ncbi:hypothetical protein COLO4_08538 [Corchorus olitorius]|uniref:Secreted protein n=1 Tax=Corchorus olitorius TaxID=93759 RepID=A0A1R3KFB9_9ROSI|nr:hypothetical protein COLO4_08538 [Corchorus olitorius]